MVLLLGLGIRFFRAHSVCVRHSKQSKCVAHANQRNDDNKRSNNDGKVMAHANQRATMTNEQTTTAKVGAAGGGGVDLRLRGVQLERRARERPVDAGLGRDPAPRGKVSESLMFYPFP